MLRAETAALKSRCPMEAGGRAASVEMASLHPERYPHGAGRYCIGRACMVWRWADVAHLKTRTILTRHGQGTKPAVSDFPPPPDGVGWQPEADSIVLGDSAWYWELTWTRPADATQRGYCGMADRPMMRS